MTFKEYIKKYNIKNNRTVLACGFNNLTDLNGIENLTNLKYLYCYNNCLTDIKGIESLVQLEHLLCYSNQITSLKPIDQLKKLKLLISDITDNIEDDRCLVKTEIRIDKISDMDYDIIK